jgi:predicted nucleic acid-binding protein
MRLLAYRILLRPEPEGGFTVEFPDQVAVVPLTSQDEVLVDTAVRIRKRHRLKLPDAIIAASAVVNDAALVSADTGFDRVTSLSRVALAD